MSWFVALAVLPWTVVAAIVTFWVREPRPLPDADSFDNTTGPIPSVRVVVPARNEARSIATCLGSLAAQDYPDFAITVVDDRSTDGTGDLASAVPIGNAREIDVVAGTPLPVGWFGKPWACVQGSAGAQEDLLLFSDADTLHAPSLLASAVQALIADEARALSLIGHQELGSFGERLVQPHIFAIMGLRYRHLDRPIESERAGDAIANGQYILVQRAAYESVGGHGAVRGEVVEDLRLAQLLTGAGHRLSIRTERDRFSTRMYRSLGEVLGGWTKNLAVGARQSAGWWSRFALPAIVGYVTLFWVTPPVALAGLLAADIGGATGLELVLAWALVTTLLGVATWAVVYRRFRVSRSYALLYPLGAAFVGLIALRSGWRGERRIEWKGRRYSSGEVVGESI